MYLAKLKRSKTKLFIAWVIIHSRLQAQELEPFSIRSNGDEPKIYIREGTKPRPNQNKPQDTPLIMTPSGGDNWSRIAGGFWISFGNAALGKSLVKISSDAVLLGHSSEFGFGIGGMLDFPFLGDPDQGLRLRIGALRMNVSADEAVLNSYASTTLEDRMNVIHFLLIYRRKFDLIPPELGTFWAGGGGYINYVFSTSLPAQGSTYSSALENSYGISLVVASGVDFKISEYNEFCLEADYIPLAGYSLLIGLRTSL